MAPGTDKIPSDQPAYFKKWLEFRVKVIHDFIVKAREKVKSVNSEINFGVYVGAWYSSYYTSGKIGQVLNMTPQLTILNGLQQIIRTMVMPII
ncbi:hypothetical protein NXX42_00150 [Bacteroides thetaiotaomicron]|nr:hypothetical protein [Bacteroides thetaiotaomicron]